MFTAEALRRQFESSLGYGAYLETGRPDQQAAWRRILDSVELTERQRALLGDFRREMHVLVCSGIWCGDCVRQCPLLARIAQAAPERIHLRFFDRDQHADFSKNLRICGGARVPVAIFAAEDFEFVSLMGDRTLARYRTMAAQQLGAACPVPGADVPDEETAAVLEDWLNEFERVQLLLRLSARLQAKHGD